jgi:hypothetical protein
LICEHHRGKPTVHIGFAGGVLLRKLACAFAKRLRDPPPDLPGELVFHAMVAGWNVTNPVNDPNSFFVYFAGDDLNSPIKIRFVGLYGPGLYDAGEEFSIRKQRSTSEAFAAVEKLDVIVTSAGTWSCQHSALYRLYNEQSQATFESLTQAGCIGDMLWNPLAENGPIDLAAIDASVLILTLMTLDKLDDFIRRQGKHVLLLIAPCSSCGASKAPLLKTILDNDKRKRLLTHLVTDSRTAGELLRP